MLTSMFTLPLLKMSGRGLCAVMIVCACVLLGGCASAPAPVVETPGGGLRLVCVVDARALEPARVAQGKIFLADGAREIEAPASAQWRLDGDLRANARIPMLGGPDYDIARLPDDYYNPNDPDGHNAPALADSRHPMQATVGRWHSLDNAPNRDPFLWFWPKGTTDEALLVCVWMIDGRAKFVKPHAIPASDKNGFEAEEKFRLTPKEARGQPILLLWQPGGFVPADGRFRKSEQAREAFIAVIFDDAPALSELLRQGLDPNVTMASNYTLLHFAAEAGSMRAMEVLLKAEPSLVFAQTMPDRDRATPLAWAVEKGRLDAVKRLLAAKSNPNPIFQDERRSLARDAIQRGHFDVLEALLDGGTRHGSVRINGVEVGD